ncbi:MAG: response regulator transcription factor [Anaerolineales bacterium]
MRVLVIEDDRRLAKLIAQVFSEEHFAVDLAHDGDVGLELALRGVHDVVVVDWMLPKRDGPAICRAMREARLKTGILMLTARGQLEDRVAGLETGADDYLVKPFAFDELLARVRALGRRVAGSQSDVKELRVGSLVMDLFSHRARRKEISLELSKTEWALLEYLMRHPGQVLTHQNILDYVWSDEKAVQSSMVAVYISYLRNRLSVAGMRDPIETVHAIGYRLVADYA